MEIEREGLEQTWYADLFHSLSTMDRRDKESHTVLKGISVLHTRIRDEIKQGGASDKLFVRLQRLYKESIVCSERELSACQAANLRLSKLIDLKKRPRESEISSFEPKDNQLEPPIKKHRSTILSSLNEPLEKWNGKGEVPQLCGCVPAYPDYIVAAGQQVAARTSKPRDSEDVWILATVIGYHADKNRYEVEDIMGEDVYGEGEENEQPANQKNYFLPRRAVIPLPLLEPPYDHVPSLHYAVGSNVLALYPQTTCFYPGTIVATPNK
eukprot:Ihof_evm1s782 gene=Ihof_evmTU1s782